jgi:hypothetical protein
MKDVKLDVKIGGNWKGTMVIARRDGDTLDRRVSVSRQAETNS